MSVDAIARRPRLAAALVFLGVFAAGILTGLPLAHWLHPPMGPPGLCGPPGPERDPDFLPRPYDRLGLDRRQLDEARPIVERHRRQMEAMVRETVSRMRALRSDFEREIRPLLDPDQARRLDDMLAHHPEFPGGPPPGQGGGPPPRP